MFSAEWKESALRTAKAAAAFYFVAAVIIDVLGYIGTKAEVAPYISVDHPAGMLWIQMLLPLTFMIVCVVAVCVSVARAPAATIEARGCRYTFLTFALYAILCFAFSLAFNALVATVTMLVGLGNDPYIAQGARSLMSPFVIPGNFFSAAAGTLLTSIPAGLLILAIRRLKFVSRAEVACCMLGMAAFSIVTSRHFSSMLYWLQTGHSTEETAYVQPDWAKTLNVGDTLLARGQVEEARRKYEDAVSGILCHCPAEGWGEYHVALAHDKLGETEKAEELYKEAISDIQGAPDTEVAKVLDSYAEFLIKSKRPLEAVQPRLESWSLMW